MPKLPSPLSQYATLREMLAAGCFLVHFQPRFHLKTGVLTGVEAFVRGRDDRGNLLLPDQFLPALEQNKSIRDLDLFVVDQTMRWMTHWKRQGIHLPPFTVNFSHSTIMDPRVPASVLAIQSRYPEFPPGMLGIEIKAPSRNSQMSRLWDELEQYRQLGLGLVLEDFGARPSCVTMAAGAPFQLVKLDRRLMVQFTANPAARELVAQAVDHCRSQRLDVVAVGVELEEQLELLRQAGCTQAQGYYYSRPLAPEQLFQRFLSQGKNLTQQE